MIYYLTGVAALNPLLASLWATCLILFILGAANWLQWNILRKKMLRILNACLGLPENFNINSEEVWLTGLKEKLKGANK